RRQSMPPSARPSNKRAAGFIPAVFPETGGDKPRRSPARRDAMPVAENLTMYLDQSRCIGCQSCVQACSECDTHKGQSMIHLETADRAHTVQTMPVVCMHCESPTCAEVCPADAIKKTADGIVMSARKQACIACNNCVLA